MRKLLYGLIAFFSAGIGLILAYYLIVPVFLVSSSPAVVTAALIAAPVFFGLIGFLLAPKIYKLFARFVELCISHMSAVPTKQIVSSVAGLILGLIIAALIGSVVTKFYIIGPYISVVLMVFFGYLGAVIGYKRTDDLASIKNFFQYNRGEKSEKAEKTDKKSAGKIPPKFWTHPSSSMAALPISIKQASLRVSLSSPASCWKSCGISLTAPMH